MAECALAIARDCSGLLNLAETLLDPSCSDALNHLVVASLQSYAGLEGALVSLEMNCGAWNDKNSFALAASEARTLLREGLEAKLKILRFVDSNQKLTPSTNLEKSTGRGGLH